MKTSVLCLLVLFSFLSCKENYSAESAQVELNIEEQAMIESTSNTFKQDEKGLERRKIIWSANLHLKVQNVTNTTTKLKEIINKHGGYISNMSLSSNNYQLSNTIELRVEYKNFDKIIEEFKNEAIAIDQISINSNDVSEEFVDIESRLKTKKEVRDRYIDVLRYKTGDVKDIIEAEEAIRKITEEIEAKEGRLRYLKDKVKYSTITTTIYEVIEVKSSPIVNKISYSNKLLAGLQNGWSIVANTFLFFINIWPLLILFSIFMWKRKWLFRKVTGK